ncbi:CocE/NonD family hydrolase [Granulicella tundricola]|uniref:Hydrolase CocE/NonD family protein n=1 Tax=Granulicella tundricola (strain ATCC BAA-1859 / DSM 23138 / MP5ACTX9) TaxID=1198114 RepID=E8X266_GRATM|nr:CocE/NonD family hydrolase [Granulicella tundricola]ADW70309.1 hydrolase CocE/NonD family protein [Granulicella tundricola MP5ACTX9]
MTHLSRAALAALSLSLCTTFAFAQDKPVGNDIPPSFTPPTRAPYKPFVEEADYTRRIAMIPMRDGTKLYTVIMIPKGAKNAPIVLTRTCYNAAARASANRETAGNALATAMPAARPGREAAAKAPSPHLIDELGLPDEVFVKAGYIRIYQDVRGKYGSEGVYLMTPPPVGPYNPTGADDTTDAYDTIDWLVKNTPESNGRVGMIGSSYEGYTVVMALLNPHPALKAAIPESPMVDGWKGDDWFHYGAFRERMLDYFVGQTAARGAGPRVPHKHHDDYANFLEAGSAGDFARSLGEDQLPYWKTVEAHPAYDGFWQSQALDKLVSAKPLTVPTMWLQGLWDQEDMWGANHAYKLWEAKDTHNDMNFLVMGPWFHSQINREGHTMGPFIWDGDTTEYVREDIFMPFFNQYLVDGAPKANTPPVLIYNTGENHWDKLQKWPLSCDKNCGATSKPLYLRAEGKLSYDAPTAGEAKFSEYVSEPANPVPFLPRTGDTGTWQTWLVQDQRFVDNRPDVLTYTSEVLTAPTRVSGVPEVNLYASTSGTDSDWIVKLIDVYPDDATGPAAMAGYELPISLDIFRGRYRKSFEHPEAAKPNAPELIKYDLPNVNHIFQPGHRIMVQVQSTLFPLYDRNPQTFVPNIFDAKAGDYKKATQHIYQTPGTASFINLPIVP